jgi:hypothetical protein
MADTTNAVDLGPPAQSEPDGLPDPNAPKYLFSGGPLHGMLMPVGREGQPVLHVETGTRYAMVKYTQNEPHPITGQPVPTWDRFVYVTEQLAGSPVQAQMGALTQAVLLAWFRTGQRIPDGGPAAIVDAPTPEHTMTCKEGGAPCFEFTHASLAKAATAAHEHNLKTGHHIEHSTSTPEPAMPGAGVDVQSEERAQ